MSDIVQRLRDRVHDSHMDNERLMDEAADELERLRATIHCLKSGLEIGGYEDADLADAPDNTLPDTLQEIDEALACITKSDEAYERASRKRDADRYRWLRDYANSGEWWRLFDDYGRDLVDGDDLDDAIDEAMRERE